MLAESWTATPVGPDLVLWGRPTFRVAGHRILVRASSSMTGPTADGKINCHTQPDLRSTFLRRDRHVDDLAPAAGRGMWFRTVISAISPGTEMLFYRGQAPADVSVDATIPALGGAVQYPLKYGYACVGRVVELGDHVETQLVGRLVFAFHPHESHFVARRPTRLSLCLMALSAEQAALLPNMETAVSLCWTENRLSANGSLIFGQGIVGLLTTATLGPVSAGAVVRGGRDRPTPPPGA